MILKSQYTVQCTLATFVSRMCFICLPSTMVPTYTIAFLFFNLKFCTTYQCVFSYRYSCSNIGPICFVVLSRSIAVCLLTSRSLCFMSNLCSSENFYSSIPKKFILSISKDVLTLKPNCKDGAT